MKSILWSGLVGVILIGCATPSQAQFFFKPKPRVNPLQRVPELIITLKTDSDERKRAKAAEELRDYDAATFGEIVPVLADALLMDKKQSVRLEALAGLARIRPVNAIAGQAMEKAAAEDESLRVRFQARTALTKYHLAGYSSKRPDSVTVNRMGSVEPPLSLIPSPPPGPSIAPPRVEVGPLPEPVVTNPSVPRPLPKGVTTPPAKKTTAEPPLQGPSLFP